MRQCADVGRARRHNVIDDVIHIIRLDVVVWLHLNQRRHKRHRQHEWLEWTDA